MKNINIRICPDDGFECPYPNKDCGDCLKEQEEWENGWINKYRRNSKNRMVKSVEENRV